GDIWACFRLKLWDRRQDRLISFAEAQPLLEAFASGTAVLDPDFADRMLSELHSHDDEDGDGDEQDLVAAHASAHKPVTESTLAADLNLAAQREIPVTVVSDGTAAAFELPAHGIPTVINTP
ncbi:MAG: hypothetical protein ACKOU6_03160, partial [Planctomycetota bacterium]